MKHTSLLVLIGFSPWVIVLLAAQIARTYSGLPWGDIVQSSGLLIAVAVTLYSAFRYIVNR